MDADAFQDVTIFQPNLPPVKWSRVENRFATTYGASYDVDVVIANPKFLVTEAMAVIGYNHPLSAQLHIQLDEVERWIRTILGSPMGNCVAFRIAVSGLPWYVS